VVAAVLPLTKRQVVGHRDGSQQRDNGELAEARVSVRKIERRRLLERSFYRGELESCGTKSLSRFYL
jgi:aminoglycoside phosphotransferase family enzyme